MEEIIESWVVPLIDAALCEPHGIIYVRLCICGLCFFLSAENINNKYWAKIGDDTADPLTDFETTSLGNGQDIPNILDQAIDVNVYL